MFATPGFTVTIYYCVLWEKVNSLFLFADTTSDSKSPSTQIFRFPPDRIEFMWPKGEKLVLTTPHGNAVGLYEQQRLRPSYLWRKPIEIWAKINVHSGLVEDMTPEEMNDSRLDQRNVSQS